MITRTKFELINLVTQESHGLFDTEMEARAVAAIDGVTSFEIMRGTENGGTFLAVDLVARKVYGDPTNRVQVAA